MQGKIGTLKSATVATVAAIAVAAVLIGPSAVLAKSDVEADRVLRYTPRLAAVAEADAPAKFPTTETETEAKTEDLGNTLARAEAEIPEPVVTTPRNHTLTQTGTSVASSGSSSSGGTSEQAQAQAILNGYIAKYPILAGTSISFGATPGGYQAVAYYTVGRILISPTHTASLERIIGHEIWHVIDYRDNGQIDWGENVPPSNYP